MLRLWRSSRSWKKILSSRVFGVVFSSLFYKWNEEAVKWKATMMSWMSEVWLQNHITCRSTRGFFFVVFDKFHSHGRFQRTRLGRAALSHLGGNWIYFLVLDHSGGTHSVRWTVVVVVHCTDSFSEWWDFLHFQSYIFFLFIIPHQTIVFFLSRFLYNININIPHTFDYFSLEILIVLV